MKIILNKKIIFLIISVVLISFSNTVLADWDGLPFTPGAIDNPPCLPSQSNCDVLPSLTSETDPTISLWAKATTKPSYTWSEINNTPTALSSFTNDLGNYGNFVTGTPWTSQGYLTSFTETDPIFSAWNKSTGISITESQISDLKSYLTSETDPSVPTWAKAGIKPTLQHLKLDLVMFQIFHSLDQIQEMKQLHLFKQNLALQEQEQVVI